MLELHSHAVSQRADEGAKHERRPEASNEQLANLLRAVPIQLVQGVHIWPLKPVTHCRTAAEAGSGPADPDADVNLVTVTYTSVGSIPAGNCCGRLVEPG
jgi:hypothetical protein